MQISIGQILTDSEVEKAVEIYKSESTHGFAKKVADQIIRRPQLARINATLGQQNDPMYLAYCLEYAIIVAITRGG